LDRETMTLSQSPSSPSPSQPPDPATVWSGLRRLHPIYADLAREFAIDAPACSELEAATDAPAAEAIERAQQWLSDMDERIQVHQLRQFLQTSSPLDAGGLVALLQHFLAKSQHTDGVRDKIDFLLVQYFSQNAPTELDDNAVDLAYVAKGLEPVLGAVELKAPVWLNALDRVLDAARKCRSLDELLHGGVLEQGRKAKAQAGDLFFLPIALVAFTRFGYLMRRVFFRLMLADLNNILDGLTELAEQGVETVDCRRAQFSAQEPIIRLRMICQSWKVMFQAEYSSGQPLRMLVDLRASVDDARGKGTEASAHSGEESEVTASAAIAKAAAAGAGASSVATQSKSANAAPASFKPIAKAGKFSVTQEDTPEFEVAAAAPEWNPEPDSPTDSKK
jgi:hypothetical protein